jgi:transcriptional regulator of acetoin/glycerol metabolism
MTACDNGNLAQMDQVIKVLAVLIDDGVDSEFLSDLAGALEFASSQCGVEELDTQTILEFCHAYLVKAYEKKVGRS